MKLKINVDDHLFNDAQDVYEALGLDTETAIRMFLKRTVLEQRLPLNTDIPVSSKNVEESADTSLGKRTKNVITAEMAEDVWDRFVCYLNEGGNISSIATDAHEASGMNQGSAFIYLNILDNFVKGKPNTRNMKMADLVYYVSRIENELDAQSYRNTIDSLNLSIPYWDKDEFGQFSDKVRAFVNSLNSQTSERPIIISEHGFMDYLAGEGYSVTTPSGNPSTVYDYAKRIGKICKREGINLYELANRINYYCDRYDVCGPEEAYGSRSSNAPRSALNCFKNYVKGL